MWVNIDDVRAELERLVRKGEEELAEEEEQYEYLKTLHMGTLFGYTNVEIMLDRLEHIAREEQKVKNREKFREEIVRSAKTSSGYDACEFKRTHVLPHFGGDGEGCNSYSCKWCYILCGLWLDEEYEEPPKPETDWSNVPVDTLVRVRNDEDSPWVLQYFKEFDEDRSYKFLAWSNGRTSKTAGGMLTGWKYCELVEGDEDGSN